MNLMLVAMPRKLSSLLLSLKKKKNSLLQSPLNFCLYHWDKRIQCEEVKHFYEGFYDAVQEKKKKKRCYNMSCTYFGNKIFFS